MSKFEFVFSLFGLLLGLGLAEVLAGFGNTIQERHRVKVGWLTPLLGLVVALDLTSFWMVAWEVRDLVPASYLTLLVGLLLCGTYYLIARIVFPRDHAEWPDFDSYYFRHKKWVIGGVMLCNAAALIAAAALGAAPLHSWVDKLVFVVFYPTCAAVFLARGRKLNIALLTVIALQYLVFPLLSVLSAR